MTKRWMGVLGAMAVGVLLTAVPPASGQYRPPQEPARELFGAPADPPAEKPWKPWLVAVLCTVGVGAIAFKKPGRTHLD